MEKEIAIKVEGVSKTFRIPHEKITSLRGAFVNLPRRLLSKAGAFSKNKGYEEFKALDDVSFEVKKGEFFGIIGRNGSGKSTLLKILAGIYQPDEGKIKVNGRISPFLELGIGFNPELSGRDNVFLNAAVLGLTHKQIEEKFDDIVRFSELKRFIDQKVKNYSSGMQVRLMFSVAIHANRDILLMDEVLAVGDTNFQSKCMTEFNRYKEMGKTVILVTHDITTVQRYCDRAMLMRNGKIEMIGDSEEVGSKYIYQNMNDEEKRIFDEEKRKREKAEKGLENMKGNQILEEKKRIEKEKEKKEEERKNKVAEITNVEFLDKDGNVKNVFQTGDDMSIKIFFKKKKQAGKINVGVGLYKDDNSYVFGYNTQMDDHNIMPNAEYVVLSFNSIPLLKGNYFLNCVCFGRIEENFYDFSEKVKTFQIFPTSETNKYRGVLSINHQWK